MLHKRHTILSDYLNWAYLFYPNRAVGRSAEDNGTAAAALPDRLGHFRHDIIHIPGEDNCWGGSLLSMEGKWHGRQ